MAAAVAVIACALAGGWLGQRLRLPGGALLGTLVAVATLGVATGVRVTPPEPARIGAFAVVGLLLGESFDAETRASLRQAAVPIVVTVGGMAVAVAGVAWALHAVFDLGLVTALLAATPGGLANMVAVSLSIGGSDPLVVGTVHLARVLVVVTVVPVVLRRLHRRRSDV